MGASTHLARKIASTIPKRTGVIIDVSNVRDPQLREIDDKDQRPIFVSTQKAFNFKSSRKNLPFARNGTLWYVIRIPNLRDDGNVYTSSFDGKKFQYHTSKKSSPHIRYHKDSTCSIIDDNNRMLTKKPDHHSCEMDDILIGQLAEMTNLRW